MQSFPRKVVLFILYFNPDSFEETGTNIISFKYTEILIKDTYKLQDRARLHFRIEHLIFHSPLNAQPNAR